MLVFCGEDKEEIKLINDVFQTFTQARLEFVYVDFYS